MFFRILYSKPIFHFGLCAENNKSWIYCIPHSWEDFRFYDGYNEQWNILIVAWVQSLAIAFFWTNSSNPSLVTSFPSLTCSRANVANIPAIAGPNGEF